MALPLALASRKPENTTRLIASNDGQDGFEFTEGRPEMFLRQKILLALLQRVGQPLGATAFVKLVFLLREKTSLKRDSSFYDFVPYRFGPFSFVLYRELNALRNQGYLAPDGERIQLAPKVRDLAQQSIEELSETSKSAVAAVASRYGKMGPSALLETVYSQYPWYASRSELTELASSLAIPQPAPSPSVFTIGYEGKSVDKFLDTLLRAGIQTILDVRFNPVSRKYGFARKSLQELAGKLGISYYHLPELGIPGEEREGLVDRSAYERLLDRYENEMLPKQKESLAHLVELLRDKPSVLLCMEEDAAYCHRGRLAKAAAVLSRLPVTHL